MLHTRTPCSLRRAPARVLLLVAALATVLLAGVAPAVAGASAADTTGLVPGDPVREIDTRGGADGGRLRGGTERFVPLNDVPADASAVVLNVTAVGAAAPGHLSVTDCSAADPTSALNYGSGEAVANQVTVGLAVDGRRGVCVTASTDVDVIIDRFAVVAPGGAAFRAAPERVWDTRSAGGIGPDGVLELDLSAAVDDTDSVMAWSGTITATGAPTAGHLTVWGCGTPRPEVSSVNHGAGVSVANHVTVDVAADRPRLCIHRSGGADIVVDTTGVWAPTASASARTTLTPVSPARRVIDTRGASPLASGEVRRVHGAADAVVFVNLTGTRAAADGWVALFPCDRGDQGTSTLNLGPGRDVAAAAVVEARDGGVCATASIDTDIVVDVFAVQHHPATSPPGDAGVPSGGEPLSASPAPSGSSSGAPVVSPCVFGPLDGVNDARSAAGVATVVTDQRTADFACEWASTLATEGRLTHSPSSRHVEVDDCGIVGETVGVGADGWDWMFDAWLTSASHRAVILHPIFERASAAYARAEVDGVVRWYGVMTFGGPC